MASPTRRGSSILTAAARTAPVVTRVTFALMLLVLALRLHHRTDDLDRRERSLRETLQAVARRESLNDRRERHLDELAGRLEQVFRTTREQLPAEPAPPVDEAVRQAGYAEAEPKVSLNRAGH